MPRSTMPHAISSIPDQLRLADLPQRKASRFDVTANDSALNELADALQITSVRKARFKGSMTPVAGRDWQLSAQLGATVVQPCSVSLEPVVTRIDLTVERHYTDAPLQDDIEAGSEVEMPEDDTLEPVPEVVDLGALLLEELSLAVPAYPRAEGVGLGSILAGPEGAAPLDDDAIKPFSALATLRDQLEKKE